MISVKLNSDLRRFITIDMMRHRFAEDDLHVASLYTALAGEVYDDVYRATDRERMLALPKGWLPRSNGISAQFGEDSGDFVRLRFGEVDGRRIIDRHRTGCARVYARSHSLSRKWFAYVVARDALKENRDEARKQIIAVLNSVSTTKRLADIWPEAVPFILNNVADTKRNLPSLEIASVNALLNLDSKAA